MTTKNLFHFNIPDLNLRSVKKMKKFLSVEKLPAQKKH